MSEVKIVRKANPSLVVSSTDPYRITGTPTKGKPPPRVQTFSNVAAGCRIVGQPAQHDMRAAGPASVGKATPATPAPLAASVAQKGPRTIAQATNAKAKAERDELATEKARLERQIEPRDTGTDAAPTREHDKHK